MDFFRPNNQNYISTIMLARQAIEDAYDCLCDIIEYKTTKNSINKQTEYKEEIVVKKQACRISYKNITNTNQSEQENVVTQIVKLFIAPEIQIKPRLKDYCYKERQKNRRI